MKVKIQIVFILLFSFFLVQPVQGQRLLKKLQQKAEQKLEKAAEKKMDEKIDESLDNLENKIDSAFESNADATNRDAQNQERMSRLLKGIGVSGEPVPFEDSYSFDQLIQMHIESFDKTGKQTSTGEFITHLNSTQKSMAYEVVSGDLAKSDQGLFIIDADNGAMIILSDEKGEKTGIVYGIGAFFQSLGESFNDEEVDLSDSPESYLSNPNVSKTGRTKTIAGYKCEEYTYEDEYSNSEIWVTKDLRMNTQDYFSTLFKTSLYTHGMGWGYMMASTSVDKNSGEKSQMEVSRVDKSSNVRYSMNDYQITNLGSFTMPAPEE